MKYIIVGSGPTGLSLAYFLVNSGYEIELIEKESQLGGSWNSQWIDKKYWSENSPRVLIYSNLTKKFLDEIGITENEISDVYGNIFETTNKLFSFIKKHFNINDYLILLKLIIKYKLVKSNLSLEEVLEKSNLSDNGKKALTILSITICDMPKTTNINNFIGAISGIGNQFKQFRDSNLWHQLIEKKLSKFSNITIRKNTTVFKLLEKNNSIEGVVYKDNKLKTQKISLANKVILCTQSSGLLNIIENSSINLKDNWINYQWFKNWVKKTFYIGFGFQLHFKEKIKTKNEWCWSCNDNWNIIILPISDWVTEFTRDDKVNTVWSCCIVNMDTKSSRINKTANECNKIELLDECIYQIQQADNIPFPYNVTTSSGLVKYDNKWFSENTGFTRGKMPYLPMKGKINNLFALGCFTETNNYMVSNMEIAIAATEKYLNKYEPNLKGFYKQNFKCKISIILIILVLSIIIFVK